MSWLRKIAGAVVELDDQPAADTPPKTLPPGTRVAQSVPSAVAPPVAPHAVDQALHGALMTAALARKTALSGVIEQAEKLRSVLADDVQRIQAAATVTSNVTADSIAQAANTHLGDLNTERNRFSQEVATARSTSVDALERQAAGLDSEVASAQAQIQQLQAQIDAKAQSAASIRSQAATTAAELDAQVNSFELSFAAVKQYIETTRDSIIGVISKK